MQKRLECRIVTLVRSWCKQVEQQLAALKAEFLAGHCIG
jgi:hypothetical protein